jgi:subtilisin family serine protease
MDALYQIENSSFVTSTLGLSARSDVPGHTAFNGSPGTAFAGESYDLNSPTAFDPFHDVLDPVGGAAMTQGIYPSSPGSWAYLNGTSMAAPHATGAAALAASEFPNLLVDPVALKQHLMGSGKPLPSTAGLTVTGDLVDAEAAVSPPNTKPKILNVRPVPGSRIKDRTPPISATVRDAETDLVKSNIQLLVDGRAKAFSYNTATDRLSYLSSRLAFGSHTVRIKATDGKLDANKSWTFRVVRP